MADEQISLPSLILIVVIGGLVVRYLFFSSATPAQQQPRDAASAARTREAAVERIQQMFPQLDRRTILWDLQRNGGSISATTERVLSGRMETVSIYLSIYLSIYAHHPALPLSTTTVIVRFTDHIHSCL